MIRTAGEGHFEDRTVSAAANPYLALAAYLVAGLDGIERGLDPGEPNLGNMYERPLDEIAAAGIQLLPQSLAEALDALRTDEVVQSGLGPIAERVPRAKSQRVGRVRQPSQPLGGGAVFDLVLRLCPIGCSNTAWRKSIPSRVCSARPSGCATAMRL